jgi:hypothetical protein
VAVAHNSNGFLESLLGDLFTKVSILSFGEAHELISRGSHGFVSTIETCMAVAHNSSGLLRARWVICLPR